ncbi:MAG: hypothetical protein KGJ90_02100 [Patescibacteria group bacterium]|nr:hypothetical protein [Patescibacteria group bacterium]
MKSLSTLLNLYTTLSQNLTSGNQSMGLQIMGDTQRYLLQKYFDNEREFQTTTLGPVSLIITAQLNPGAISATLVSSWPYPSCTQLVDFAAPTTAVTVTATGALASGATSATLSSTWAYNTGVVRTTFSNGDILPVSYTNGSATANFEGSLSSAATATMTLASSSDQRTVTFINGSAAITWAGGLQGFASTSISTLGQRDYVIPAQISKITSTFIQVGQLRFVPVPLQTRVDWDRVNFLPYTSDIVNYAYIYGGKMKFWPGPSTTGNIIQFNYKSRVPEFSSKFLFSDTSGTAYVAGATTYDYQKGTVTPPAVGGITVTGASTAWNSTGGFPLNVDVSWLSLYLKIDQPNGDGIWYPIYQFTSDTALTLATPIQNQFSAAGGATYSIGQLPILQEDFHDMLVDRPLVRYFSTIAKNSQARKDHEESYNRSLVLLEDYAGTKQVSVDLEAEPVLSNPNNYPYAQP